jgi:hypothetical protein
MAETLTDRASLERAFYRLLNTDQTDDALTEHDPAGYPREAVYQALQQGVYDAQDWLIRSGLKDRWLETASLSSWTADGDFQYEDLPTDFLRLQGDERTSALRDSSGHWGRLIGSEYRYRVLGNYYWLQNERIYVAEAATIPTAGLSLDYHFRHPQLADATTVDFPVEDRPLIVACAAVGAMEESWLAGGPEMEAKLDRNLTRRQNAALRRVRRTGQQTLFQPTPTMGTHWI